MSLKIVEPIRQRWARAGAKMFREAVERAKRGTDKAALLRALEAGNLYAALETIGWDKAVRYLRAAIPIWLRGLFDEVGHAYIREAVKHGKKRGRVLKRVVPEIDNEIELAFDSVDPHAVEYIRQHAGEMIKMWGDGSVDGLRALLEDSFRKGIPPRQLARLIMESGIGLNDAQSQALGRYRERLVEDGRLDEDEINARLERRSAQYERQRGEMIARTETIDASSEGQEESWRQAYAQELLDDSDMVEWLANPGACDRCLSMDGQQIPLGEFLGGAEFKWQYTTKNGVKAGTAHAPTAHPDCECGIGIR